jgi:hypothetical protein
MLISNMHKPVYTVVVSLSPLLRMKYYPVICKSTYIRPYLAAALVGGGNMSYSLSLLFASKHFYHLLVLQSSRLLFFVSYLSLSFLEQILCRHRGQCVYGVLQCLSNSWD